MRPKRSSTPGPGTPRLHPTSTLADLSDPLIMPQDLTKAHATLDRAVDLCYREKPFENEQKRFEFLFERWEGEVGPVVVWGKKGRQAR